MIHQEDVDFLEHYGVKGMKWGVRRTERKTARAQANIDKFKRVADGSGSKKDRKAVYNQTGRASREVAAQGLMRGRAVQKRIVSGESRVTARLAKLQGVDFAQLDYGGSRSSAGKIGSAKAENKAFHKENKTAAKAVAAGSLWVAGLAAIQYTALRG